MSADVTDRTRLARMYGLTDESHTHVTGNKRTAKYDDDSGKQEHTRKANVTEPSLKHGHIYSHLVWGLSRSRDK